MTVIGRLAGEPEVRRLCSLLAVDYRLFSDAPDSAKAVAQGLHPE